ncbi:unknown protein [Oryza sativa Japonica Group]|uniref:Uncharacterized protein n=1 Tax=Oryza sativa subsp. japonica TaxID=39947 RepID=Q5ZCS2_ORYSJ|nr:unknown protein [Oryza sativa Japonica Group]
MVAGGDHRGAGAPLPSAVPARPPSGAPSRLPSGPGRQPPAPAEGWCPMLGAQFCLPVPGIPAVRGRVEKPGRSLPAVAGHQSPVAAVDRSRAAARPRRRPSSFVVWFEGEYRWVHLVVLYVYMSSKVATDHPISGEVAILLLVWS